MAPVIAAALVGARNAKQAKADAHALSFSLTPDEHKPSRAAFDDVAKKLKAQQRNVTIASFPSGSLAHARSGPLARVLTGEG